LHKPICKLGAEQLTIIKLALMGGVRGHRFEP
jgi:hypothetical protein